MAGSNSFFGRLLVIVGLVLAVAGFQTNAHAERGQSLLSKPSASMSTKGAAAQRKSGNRYFIEFRSRYAYTYGHSYVVFGRLDARGRMIKPEVAGLAPKSDDPSVYMAGHMVPVEASTGWTDGDLEPEYMSAYWRVILSEAQYKEVVAYIRKLQANSPVWHASLYNCNAFVGKIAGFMGYRAPFHWLLPQDYITKLRKTNGGPNAIGWTRPAEPKGNNGARG